MTTRRRTPTPRRRFAPSIAAGALLLSALTGCSAERQVQPDDLDAINSGRNAEVGVVEVRNLLIISTGEGEPGRVLGVLLNSADEAAEVLLADANEQLTVSVPADGELAFESSTVMFETTDEAPGGLAPVEVTVDGGETESLDVPVLDGSLERYRPYLPEGG